MTTARDVIESFGYKAERTDAEILKLLHDRSGCGRRWDGMEFMLTPTHAELYCEGTGKHRAVRIISHEELLREYREQMKGANEMTNELGKKVTFTAEMVSLARIEARIAGHMQSACASLLEVGRCLCEAKDGGLVPHGEWEEWVRRNTGMNERGAQRLMQAARNAPAGSMLAQLPVSKITAILALPEPEREEMAEKAVVENLTVKELRRQISDLNAEKTRQEQSINQLRYDKGQESKRVLQLQKQLQNQLTNNATLDGLRKDAEAKADALRQQLDEVLNRPAAGISPEAQAQIDRLSADLEDALKEIEEQAQLRQTAQDQLLNAAMAGGGIAEEDRHGFGPDDLAAAVRAFLGAAGVMVHMGAELSRLNAGTKAEMRHQVEMIGAWAQGAARALNVETLVVEG